jgi:hypothetical protein
MTQGPRVHELRRVNRLILTRSGAPNSYVPVVKRRAPALWSGNSKNEKRSAPQDELARMQKKDW